MNNQLLLSGEYSESTKFSFILKKDKGCYDSPYLLTVMSKREELWYSIYNLAQEKKLAKIFKLFREVGIEPILIKGWAASLKYPNRSRQYSDMDLCIAPQDFKRAEQLLIRENFANQHVDLHKGFRHLDNLLWENLYSNSILIKVEDTNIRILREEDHLRILCNHWLNDGGANKERLWDIYYAVENRSSDFDWNRLTDGIGAKRRGWIYCCLAIAKKYLGLNLSETPVNDYTDYIPRWVSETLASEWEDDVKLQPLSSKIGKPKELWQQIKKRFPPNPIQATIEMEGWFDDRSRVFYQTGDIFKRFFVSINREILTKIFK